MSMPEITMDELIEICIGQNWENLNPCELPEFNNRLWFPDTIGECSGNCVNCLLVACGIEQIYTR